MSVNEHDSKRDQRADLDLTAAVPRLSKEPDVRPVETTGGPSAPSVGHSTPLAEPVHLVDYFRVLHKRRWTAITAFLLMFGTITVYSFMATPIYSAKVQILIENENPNVSQKTHLL